MRASRFVPGARAAAKVHEKHVGQTPSSAPDPLVGLLGHFGTAREPTGGSAADQGVCPTGIAAVREEMQV